MHKIILSELSRPDAITEGLKRIRGYVIAIEPPIDVNPDVVSRIIVDGALDPRAVEDRGQNTTVFSEVLLIGSTDVRTTIYARLKEPAWSDSLDRRLSYDFLSERVVELLGLLGVVGYSFDREITPLTDTV
ncbi:MAG: hypothetical protein ACXWLH_04560 [Candidatus Saccharimonadales bacterium]